MKLKNSFNSDSNHITIDKNPEELFELLEEIESGTYGSIYKAQHKTTGDLLAIKTIELKGSFENYINKIRVLKGVNSPYIIRYYGCFKKENHLWIGTEYCEFGRRYNGGYK